MIHRWVTGLRGLLSRCGGRLLSWIIEIADVTFGYRRRVFPFALEIVADLLYDVGMPIYLGAQLRCSFQVARTDRIERFAGGVEGGLMAFLGVAEYLTELIRIKDPWCGGDDLAPRDGQVVEHRRKVGGNLDSVRRTFGHPVGAEIQTHAQNDRHHRKDPMREVKVPTQRVDHSGEEGDDSNEKYHQGPAIHQDPQPLTLFLKCGVLGRRHEGGFDLQRHDRRGICRGLGGLR